MEDILNYCEHTHTRTVNMTPLHCALTKFTSVTCLIISSALRSVSCSLRLDIKQLFHLFATNLWYVQKFMTVGKKVH